MVKVVHVKKSRGPVPQLDLPAGSSYYHWSLMSGGRGVKRFSKTPPRRSQLTNSEFKAALYDIEDALEALSDADDLDGIIEDIRQLGSEQEEKHQNLPDNLQYSGTGELLEGRAQACEEWASELEQVEKPEEVSDSDVDDYISDNYEEDEVQHANREEIIGLLEGERFDEFKEAVSNCQYGGE
jgi:hypothetical protein